MHKKSLLSVATRLVSSFRPRAQLCAAGALALAACASDAPAEALNADPSSPELLASLEGEGFLLHAHQVDLNGQPSPAATDGMITADDSGTLGSNTDATFMDWFAVQVSANWPACLGIRYRAHLAYIGDTEWVEAPGWVGAWDHRIEAVQFEVDRSRCPGDDYAGWSLSALCTAQGGETLTSYSGPFDGWCGTKGESRALTSLKLYRGVDWRDATTP